MSVSLNSTNDSTSAEAIKELAEEVADLSQNHDEIVDLEVGLAALGGLRHSAACSASERSSRRYDERNHRFHESRMKALGMEGEEKEPEAEDMSQQVLIRSPTIHNHYANSPTATQPATEPQQPNQPLTNQPGLSTGMKALIGGLIATSLLGPALGGYALYRSTGDTTTTINQPIERAPGQNIGTLPPIPPDNKKAP